MTFEELDCKFPNGFTDAEINACAINYEKRTAVIHINLRGNPPDSLLHDEYRKAAITLSGMFYFAIDPPDADHLFYPQRPIQVDGHSENALEFPSFAYLKPKLPENAFCCRFYVHDWNSFIHIAAKDADFSWFEDGMTEALL
ncbi:hypothetical protein [Terracidiphilus gabretensis]|uniref:hypothetical protein n=1 Tax=Terracidiphilus gabretensis TaxID=1577687 RepID=UPI00071B1DF7|nr:hypothetical protein [Terracidiphilus gabretensis]